MNSGRSPCLVQRCSSTIERESVVVERQSKEQKIVAICARAWLGGIWGSSGQQSVKNRITEVLSVFRIFAT